MPNGLTWILRDSFFFLLPDEMRIGYISVNRPPCNRPYCRSVTERRAIVLVAFCCTNAYKDTFTSNRKKAAACPTCPGLMNSFSILPVEARPYPVAILLHHTGSPLKPEEETEKKRKKRVLRKRKRKKDLPDPFGSPLASDESFRSFLTAALSADFDGPADAAALASFTLSSSRHG